MPKRSAKQKSRRFSRDPFRLRGEVLEPRRLLAFDPSGMEQAYLEDINRMRLDPQGELDVLFSSTVPPLRARDPSVQSAMDFFNVSTSLLLSQWSQLTAVDPLAWNEDLYDAAEKHNTQMQLNDQQKHQLPGELDLGQRVTAEGYQYRRLNENIYAFAEGHMQGHAGFVIDWGNGPGGIQDPPGHRDAIMDGRLTDVGIAVLADNSPINSVGPNLVTQDFGQPSNAGNPFVLGVTWRDNNSNGIYDSGEGLGNVNIVVSGPEGTFTTQSMSAGGYQVRVPDGVYQVTAAGGSFGGARVISNVVVSGEHRKVDFQPNQGSVPPIANPDAFSTSEDVANTYNVIANDRYPNGNGVSGNVNITAEPQHGTITNIAVNGRVTYKPDDGYSGGDSFRYSVTDNQGITSNTTTVTISVAAVNDAPTAQSFAMTTDQNMTLTIPLSSRVADADGTIDWSTLEVTRPTQGSAVADAGERAIRYTPPTGYAGVAQFTYRVADNNGAFTPHGTITVDVEDINDVPQATNDVFATLVGQSQVLPVLLNDTDRDGDIGNATVVLVSPPASGQAVAASNTVQYAPTAQFVGADTFSYRVVDPDGAVSNTATVTVYVTESDKRWQNPVNSRDVNGDGIVAATDAIQIINRIGTNLADPGPGAPTSAPPFLDVDNSGIVAATDVLMVINQLAANSQSPPASAGLVAVGFDLELDVAMDDADHLPTAVAANQRSAESLAPERVDALFAAPLAQSTSVRRTSRLAADDADHAELPWQVLQRPWLPLV